MTDTAQSPPADVAQNSASTLGIPAKLREFLDIALQAVWAGIGPAGRSGFRELQRELAGAGEAGRDEILRRFIESFQQELDRAERDPDLLVYSQMPASSADKLIARREQERTVIADSVLLAHADPTAIQEIATALRQSSLGVSQRERLLAGLGAVIQPGETWSVPCDLLLGGVEGALWELASVRKVTVTDAEGRPRDHEGRPVRSVNGTLRPETGLELSHPLRQFLDDRLFAGPGHSVRHRRLPALQREWTAYALVALRGLLDHVGDYGLIDALSERLHALAEESDKRN
jgi:hypothetical protein